MLTKWKCLNPPKYRNLLGLLWKQPQIAVDLTPSIRDSPHHLALVYWRMLRVDPVTRSILATYIHHLRKSSQGITSRSTSISFSSWISNVVEGLTKVIFCCSHFNHTHHIASFTKATKHRITTYPYRSIEGDRMIFTMVSINSRLQPPSDSRVRT